MASIKQIDANRRNAKKSTGPRTSTGKTASCMNALKTGIDAASHVVRGEDPEALHILTGEYYDHFQPATAQARALVDTLISSEWLLRRLNRVEAQIWEREFQRKEEYDDLIDDVPLGQIFCANHTTFARLQRRIDSTQRTYHRALEALQPLEAEPTGVTANLTHTTQPATPERGPVQIGFVPQPRLAGAERPAANHPRGTTMTLARRLSPSTAAPANAPAVSDPHAPMPPPQPDAQGNHHQLQAGFGVSAWSRQ